MPPFFDMVLLYSLLIGAALGIGACAALVWLFLKGIGYLDADIWK